MITEDQYIESLYKLYTDGFRTYHVDCYDELLEQMQNKRLRRAYNFSSILDKHNMSYKKIYEIADLFPDIFTINANTNHNIDELNIPNIQKKLKEKERIIRAFDRFDEIVDAENTIYTRRDLYEENYSTEMIRRLHQMVNCFELECLGKMGVRLMTITEIKNMSHNQLRGYYRECTGRIKECIANNIKICSMFQRLVTDLEHMFCH